MHTSAIIQEIQKLPLNKKFLIVEQTIKAIKNEDISQQMSIVAEELYTDYKTDKELTIFTQLDLDNFYETK